MPYHGEGRLLRRAVAAGRSHDILTVPTLLQGQPPTAVLADRAYEANSLKRHLQETGAVSAIPSTRSRREPIPHDPVIYKLRNRIERCFNKLKHFRCFASRYDRLAAHYLAFIQIAAAMIWVR